MTSTTNKQVTIGDRLNYGYDRCTVKYIGTVKGTTGSWLGVEWDDPTRGKHSGEFKGEQYFACKPNKISDILHHHYLELSSLSYISKTDHTM